MYCILCPPCSIVSQTTKPVLILAIHLSPVFGIPHQGKMVQTLSNTANLAGHTGDIFFFDFVYYKLSGLKLYNRVVQRLADSMFTS